MPPFIFSKHRFEMYAARRNAKAGRAVVHNYRQTGIRGICSSLPLAHVHQWANHAQIASVNLIVGLHGFQSAPMKQTHHQRFGQIVQMLREDHNVIPVFARGGIEGSATHAGTVSAKGVATHIFAGAAYDILAAVKVGHTERWNIGVQV